MDAKTSKRKMLTAWWQWAHSPQAYCSLRTDNVTPYDTALLPHHQQIREVCTSWSHSLGLPSLTWPLKMLRWNSEGVQVIWTLATQDFLYVCIRAKSLQLCLTLCNPMDCSPPGSSVHGILCARVLEWVALPPSRGSSWLRNQTCIPYISCISRWVLNH